MNIIPEIAKQATINLFVKVSESYSSDFKRLRYCIIRNTIKAKSNIEYRINKASCMFINLVVVHLWAKSLLVSENPLCLKDLLD